MYVYIVIIHLYMCIYCDYIMCVYIVIIHLLDDLPDSKKQSNR